MSRTGVLTWCTLLLLCGTVFGQIAPTKPQVTFKSNSRLVVVDVVVTDSHGEPVTGLTRDDFTVMEDGKPQVVHAFEAHASSPQLSLPAVIATAPPDEHSNAPSVTVQGPLNILVLDMLNTELINQADVRQHMLRFLKQMPPGQLITVFTLGQQLHMVQGLTDDSSKLTPAVERVLPQKPALLKTDDDRLYDQKQVDEAKAINPLLAEKIAQTICRDQANRIDNRVEMTLEALRQITQVLAGYPGRKNLIWLSGGLPIRFDPNDEFPEFQQRIEEARNYSQRLHDAAILLAAAQVAIYPVDARGLEPFQPQANIAWAQAVRVPAKIRGTSQDIHDAMQQIAEQTGGKAFYDRNDLDNGISRSIAHGSTYYTLAYAPFNGKWDGRLRQIKVKLARDHVQLAYRREYFAVSDDAQPTDEKLKSAAETAMLPSSLGSTEVLLSATVLPSGSSGRVKVQYFVHRDQLPTRDAQNRQRALRMDFMVTAWDEQGNITGKMWQTLHLAANSKAFANIEKVGFSKLEELTVAPGTRHLRVGLMDRNTGKIGTVDINLNTQAPDKSD
jgi:VWFA-related protein